MVIDPSTARRNTLLAAPDAASLAALLPELWETPLTLGQVLHDPGAPIRDVHFPLLGVVSLVADLGPDQLVETATIGRDGMVGLPVFLGADVPSERSIVQVHGQALTLNADALREHLTRLDSPLAVMLRRSAQALFTQVPRNAACNRVHTVRQRAARWLLMTADRMDSTHFQLTQHFLAQMLAVRRTSVGEAAQFLARTPAAGPGRRAPEAPRRQERRVAAPASSSVPAALAVARALTRRFAMDLRPTLAAALRQQAWGWLGGRNRGVRIHQRHRSRRQNHAASARSSFPSRSRVCDSTYSNGCRRCARSMPPVEFLDHIENIANRAAHILPLKVGRARLRGAHRRFLG